MKKIVLFLLLFPLFLFSLMAEPSSPEPGSNLTIQLAVIGPGDALYLKWGHIGMIVRDGTSGEDRFYDYGLFSFETENFYRNFAMGRLIYSVGVSPVDWNLSRAVKAGREIHLVDLNLSPGKKVEIKNFLENNVRKENRNYLYHHYYNNCATKIRDILDDATGGQLRTYTDKRASMTLRDHTVRHLQEVPLFGVILPFAMGPVIDTPITVWDELFLPATFLTALKDFRYYDENGTERKLVSRIRPYHAAPDRPPVPEKAQPFWPWTLAWGMLAALVLGSGLTFFHKKPGQLILGLGNLGLGLMMGLPGTLLFFMSFFTDHDVTYGNLNLLFINPLMLLLIPAGIALMGRSEKRQTRAFRWMRIIWALGAAGATAALINLIFSITGQKNIAPLVFYLPPALTLVFLPAFTAKIKKKRKNTESLHRR
jgi:hypothetical protein